MKGRGAIRLERKEGKREHRWLGRGASHEEGGNKWKTNFMSMTNDVRRHKMESICMIQKKMFMKKCEFSQGKLTIDLHPNNF